MKAMIGLFMVMAAGLGLAGAAPPAGAAVAENPTNQIQVPDPSLPPPPPGRLDERPFQPPEDLELRRQGLPEGASPAERRDFRDRLAREAERAKMAREKDQRRRRDDEPR